MHLWRAAALCVLCLVASIYNCPMDALCCKQLHWPALRLYADMLRKMHGFRAGCQACQGCQASEFHSSLSLTDHQLTCAATGSAPTAVDVPARRGSRTRAGEGTDGAAPAAAGAGMEGTVPQRLPAPTGAVASSSQGPTKGQALAAGKVKASRMLPRRTDLGGGSSGGTDASRQAVAPAAGGSKPGGGRQPHSNGQQPRGSGAGKKNQAAAAKKGAGSGQQPRGGGAEKENQAAAANEGAAPGRGADGKVGSAGAGQREGVAGLGEPAGKDTQPRKRAEKRKGVAGLGEPAGKDTQPKQRAPAPKRGELMHACCLV